MLNSKATSRSGTGSFELTVFAYGAARLSIAELADLRQRSIERFSAQLRPQLLKHSDEQTLAAAAALDRAVGQMPWCESFADWAVVSATQYLGRTAFAAVIAKYKNDGPWGVSVQVIPHTSPHALASTLSLALASHGPCIGAGTAPGEERHALLTAATLLERPEVAGVWVVFSGWSHGSANRCADDSHGGPCCLAAVLAVGRNRSAASQSANTVGRIDIRAAAGHAKPSGAGHPAPANLTEWLTA
ncbi:MAG TPA: hypothetical protein PK867_09175, partial [Pirellulales bacterium]|nr:hypothetical protein [Pirellulales bacterium]